MARPLLASFVAFLAFTSPSALAQSEATSKPLTWDVISVKPNRSLDTSSSMRMKPDGVELRNMTLHALFINAFTVRSESQVLGYPAWVNTDHFDIQAKMDADTAATYRALKGQESNEQWHDLVRQILEERFGLKYHTEQRELPVYQLVVARKGPRLKESAPEQNGTSSIGPGKLKASHYTMSSLAFSLSGPAGRVILDKTGLSGEYDFELAWAPDGQPDGGPSIFSALQDQLGLKLEPAKAPLDVVVIDHLERPSEN